MNDTHFRSTESDLKKCSTKVLPYCSQMQLLVSISHWCSAESSQDGSRRRQCNIMSELLYTHSYYSHGAPTKWYAEYTVRSQLCTLLKADREQGLSVIILNFIYLHTKGPKKPDRLGNINDLSFNNDARLATRSWKKLGCLLCSSYRQKDQKLSSNINIVCPKISDASPLGNCIPVDY